MSVLKTPSLDGVFDALGNFIAVLLPVDVTRQIVRGNANRVAMPLEGFVQMTEINQSRLATNVSTYNDSGTATGGSRAVQASMQIDIQIDCYGPSAGDWAAILVMMLRDPFACESMAPVVQPLYADDAHSAPLVNGEDEYEQRWIITAHMQYNPVITAPQQFAEVLEAGLVNVEATFKPEGTQ